MAFCIGFLHCKTITAELNGLKRHPFISVGWDSGYGLARSSAQGLTGLQQGAIWGRALIEAQGPVPSPRGRIHSPTASELMRLASSRLVGDSHSFSRASFQGLTKDNLPFN